MLKTGTLLPAEEKDQGNLITVNKYRWKAVKKTEPDSSQEYPGNRQEATAANCNTEETVFTLRVTEHGKELPKEAVSLHLWRQDIQNSIGKDSRQLLQLILV